MSCNVADILTVIGFGWAQVLLRDPSDENVIPVVEELRRRLAPSSAAQHDGKDNLSGQHDAEAAEEDGKFSCHFLKLQMSEAGKYALFFVRLLYLCNVDRSNFYHICVCIVCQFPFYAQ